MKIDTDLRAAIRAAHNVQKLKNRNTWQIRRDRTCEAIKKLTSEPKIASQVQAAKRVLAKAEALHKAAHESFAALGINADMDTITDAEKYKRAGGVQFKALDEVWSFDDIMARLAAANEKDGHAILKLLGIKWD